MPTTTTSGISGVDQILYGGLPKGSSIIVEGSPGTGKTTLGVQFLHHGAVEAGEPGIYITFEEFPQQIYQDMLAFGWDLRDLEKRNLLRVVSIKPDVLLNQMKMPDGLFEQLVREIGCQRVVVDSISLFHYLFDHPQAARDALYNIRNIFRKHGLTALLISEYSQAKPGQVPFDHYVVDGVVRLALVEQMSKFRKRTLEITKMRGRKFAEGEHIYRITDRGIHLIPALTMVEDIVVATQDRLSTGISELDRLLAGGIQKGSICVLDTNSKANIIYLLGSILAQRIREQDKLMTVVSNFTSIEDLSQLMKFYDIDLADVHARHDGIYFIEHYLRVAPPALNDVVFRVNSLSNEEYLKFLQERISPILHDNLKRGCRWFIYYDLNTMYTQRGAEFVKRFFTEETAWASSVGITLFATCNFTEIGEETASFLERSADTVIRTWVDVNYQYLQVKKSPNGYISEPYIVETVSSQPYIQLI